MLGLAMAYFLFTYDLALVNTCYEATGCVDDSHLRLAPKPFRFGCQEIRSELFFLRAAELHMALVGRHAG